MRIENTGFGNIRLIQDPDSFCYGIDAVILADFASGISGRWKSAADLGTGTGIIPFILIHKNPEKVAMLWAWIYRKKLLKWQPILQR